MRELFESAERSVLLSGFAVHRGKAVLAALARRMSDVPTLKARLFLNVLRPYGNPASDAELLREFGTKFTRQHWGGTLPEVYYDPRALAKESGARASLHAKCVVVDDRVAFVTSANLTEAAQQRNIEAGVLVEEEAFARSLRAQFDALVDAGALRRLPL
jgi:phosphatidylserine/phosphatidylglycerophosphate/cardiolipin synthase-like enzyme